MKKIYYARTICAVAALMLAVSLILGSCSLFRNDPPATSSSEEIRPNVPPIVFPELSDTPGSQTVTDAPPSTPTESVTDSESLTDEPVTPTPTESVTEPPTVEIPPIVDTSIAEYAYDDMVADLAELAAAYSEQFSYREIGTSCDGRTLYVAILGSANAKNQIIVDAGTHGREYLTPLFVMATLEYYLREYDTALYEGMSPSQLFSDTALYVVPMMNPDGITISQFGAEALLTEELRTLVREIYQKKKDAGLTYQSFELFQRYWKANGRGVDINRNFDVTSPNGKEYVDPPTSPDSAGYPGEHPASEPEVIAYVDLVNSLSNPIACISVHSQGNLIYWDCGQDYSGRVTALELANAVKGVSEFPLYYADSFTAASSDWCMLAKGIPSITVETGKGVCPLPLEQFESIFTSCKHMFLAAAHAMK